MNQHEDQDGLPLFGDRPFPRSSRLSRARLTLLHLLISERYQHPSVEVRVRISDLADDGGKDEYASWMHAAFRAEKDSAHEEPCALAPVFRELGHPTLAEAAVATRDPSGR